MEKEIIIDGVDVSKCCDFAYNKKLDNGEIVEYCCFYIDDDCEGQKCYYKELNHLKQKYNTIFKSCLIKPLELEGVIIGIYTNTKGIEYQVKYYWNGEPKTEYFFEFEIEVQK